MTYIYILGNSRGSHQPGPANKCTRSRYGIAFGAPLPREREPPRTAQFVAVRYSVFQCVCCNVIAFVVPLPYECELRRAQCVAVCCSVLQCVCCNVIALARRFLENASRELRSVLQCVAVCYNVCVAMSSRLARRFLGNVSYKVLQCVAVWCSVLQCGAVCCSVVQCVAVWCSVLQCGAVCCNVMSSRLARRCLANVSYEVRSVLQCVAVCCNVCLAVCCSVLQCLC